MYLKTCSRVVINPVERLNEYIVHIVHIEIVIRQIPVYVADKQIEVSTIFFILLTLENIART